ncbi:hypothetical protein PMAYCL1PPCAC_18104, partial [Pristionchus mayeri]
EGKERGVNGHSEGHIPILPKHTQGPSTSSDGPLKIFVDQKTGQKYRTMMGQDGSQILTPIQTGNQNIKVIGMPACSTPMDSPLSAPSSHTDHQSSHISSTTTQPSSHSHYHSLSSHSSSFPVQSHPHLSHSSHSSSQYHHPHHDSVTYGESSSNNHHSTMPLPLPPSSSSTNYIQLMPHSSVPSSYGPPTTTSHLQYTQYQGQTMSAVDNGNGGREEKRQMNPSISNATWNPSSGQYVVDAPKVGGDTPTKRRRVNNRGH